MKTTVSIKLDPKLIRSLRKLQDDIQGKAFEGALIAGALVVENRAKELVSYKTGTLRRSIHHNEPYKKGKGLLIDIGTDVEYAARVEFGFSDKDSLGRSYHQPAKPYLRPALDENKSKIQAEIAAALKDIINGY